MERREFSKEIAFISAFGIFIFIWALSQPYNMAPDEHMRYGICKYLYQYRTLPHGGDPLLRDGIWGYSYAFFPILSNMLSAVFMTVVSFISTNEFVLVMAARMVSLLCGVGTAWFVLRIGDALWEGRRIYKWMFAIMTMLLPQSVFLFTYINNDSLALLATAMIIYSWILGQKSDWSYPSCFLLAAGICLCALSYYNAYGVILASMLLFGGYLLLNWRDVGMRIILLKKGALISAVVLCGISWWFVRNGILYEGDILGLATSEEYSQIYGAEQIKPSNRQTPYLLGKSLGQMLFGDFWIRTTMLSFVGCFGYMSIPLNKWMYLFYGGIVAAGLAGCMLSWLPGKHKVRAEIKERMFIWALLLTAVVPNILNIIHSYFVDFEPQGRYSMPMLFSLMGFSVWGWEKFTKGRKAALCGILLLWTALTACSYLFFLVPGVRGRILELLVANFRI